MSFGDGWLLSGVVTTANDDFWRGTPFRVISQMTWVFTLINFIQLNINKYCQRSITFSYIIYHFNYLQVKKYVKEECNTDMAVIPPGCTSKLQPCDVSWNRPMKEAFRESYDAWLVDGPVDLTRHGNRRAPDRSTLLGWIKEAWATVTPAVIRKSFKVTGK